MNSLERVQKTFGVFRTVTKVLQVLFIVGSACCGVMALSAMTIKNGGQVFSIFGTPIDDFFEGDLTVAFVKWLSAAFIMTAYAIVCALTCNYLKHENADGTPFTADGAKRLQKLGIRCIYVPIIALTVSEIIAVCYGVKDAIIGDNLPSTALGIVFILASLVFSYGAELEVNREKLDEAKEK